MLIAKIILASLPYFGATNLPPIPPEEEYIASEELWEYSHATKQCTNTHKNLYDNIVDWQNYVHTECSAAVMTSTKGIRIIYCHDTAQTTSFYVNSELGCMGLKAYFHAREEIILMQVKDIIGEPI